MKVLKRREPSDSEPTATFTCGKCHSLLNGKKSEGEYVFDFRDGNFYIMSCPVCNAQTKVAATLFN